MIMNSLSSRFFTLILCTTMIISCCPTETVYIPVIDGEWQNITDMPDLGDYHADRQQPVDFAVWQAVDGTWQLWSCIRGTKYPGRGRLFYRWEGQSLADTAWKPMGIAMVADTTLGEIEGGLQAPFVFKENGVYYMFYGDWNNICLAKSEDGKTFTRVLNDKNNAALFSGPLYNTRDPMALKVDDTYYCYYCAHNEIDNGTFEAQGAIYCRTSKDMKKWSDPVVVSRGGTPLLEADCPHCDMECPFVVQYKNKFILFRSQLYGRNRLNTQYCSDDPLNFGDGCDDFRVGRMYVAAPEVIRDGEQYYVVSLKRRLNGMEIAKLRFVEEKRKVKKN